MGNEEQEQGITTGNWNGELEPRMGNVNGEWRTGITTG